MEKALLVKDFTRTAMDSIKDLQIKESKDYKNKKINSRINEEYQKSYFCKKRE